MQRRLPFANEKKQNRAHKKTGKEDADGDQHTELRETQRPTQNQRKKSDRGGERAKENCAAKFCNGSRDTLTM